MRNVEVCQITCLHLCQDIFFYIFSVIRKMLIMYIFILIKKVNLITLQIT
jgi:hypothetical protein